MKCPSCGAGGRITREKVNTRLVCKKCLRVFHITPSGNAVLGEPAASKDHAKPQNTRPNPQHNRIERFDGIASKLTQIKLPQIPPMLLAVIGGLVLVSGIGYWFFSKQPLASRAELVARSIQKTDMKQVIDLAAPGTEMDAMRWYSDIYKQYMNLKLVLAGQESGITIQPPGTPEGGATPIDVLFSRGGKRFDGSLFNDMLQPNPSLANAKQELNISMFWTTDIWGNWLLDGTKTLGGKTSP